MGTHAPRTGAFFVRENMQGKLITIEGGEKVGKTTLIRSLKFAYPSFAFTREPFSDELGAIARSASDPLTQLFLFQADRAMHCKGMSQLFQQGLTTVCDRFTDSTLAYQGYGHGLDLEMIASFNRIASRGLVPLLTILLDIDPDVALSRGVATDAIERLDLAFHQRVRDGYLSMAAAEPGRFVVIDAGLPQEQVLDVARKAIASCSCGLFSTSCT